MRPGTETLPGAPGGSDSSRAAAWTEAPTRAYERADPGQRWLIQTDEGELQLVENERELAELVRWGRVTSTTSVYAVGDGPRAFGEIPELARVMSKEVSSEPPSRRDRRSPERAMLSEELAVLNLPLEGDVEYIGEKPAGRWPKRLAAVVALAAVAVVGYPLVAPRWGAWRSLAVSRLTHRSGAPEPVAAARKEPAPAQPSAAIEPSQAKGTVAAAPTGASASPAAAAAAPPPPLAASTVTVLTVTPDHAGSAPAGQKPRHGARRHRSRHHAPSGRRDQSPTNRFQAPP